MGLGEGFVKYVIFTILTPVGFASMYVFGGTIDTFFSTLNQLFSGNYVGAFVEYFVYSALPPTSLEQVLIQTVIGSFVAGIFWLIGMAIYYNR